MASPDETRSDAPPTPEPRPPSVDRLARAIADVDLPHPLLVDAARSAVASGNPATAEQRARNIAGTQARSLLTSVVNATGVLLHTNMGRSPWMNLPGNGSDRYSSLELDLDSGERGSRQDRAPRLLARMCGAESAMVVNNCAAGVLLALAALADGRGVVVSRGELVEIGGGFRIPEVMSQSGADLVEVGTTNRTRLVDYEAAVNGNDVALALSVHRSNYRITGFTESVAACDLTGLGVPVLADLGSGLVDSACQWLDDGPPSWLEGEPAVRQTLEAGVDLVTFSGDKLLGGPQAGIIAGRADLVARCAAHPLARALRPGSLVLGSLQELALAYLSRDGRSIPFWRMAVLPVGELRRRASAISVDLAADTMAVPGGGTLPGVEIPSAGLMIPGDRVAELRAGTPPVIARVHDGSTVIDLRTVHPHDDDVVRAAVNRLT
ncbi:MAG: L-seryl-tRNA(Sec) selenium transferase [Acidimicrobiales bacterium]|nr:L-seryl-tRNA(Sec) selenium transferase [Actinomycetota bacterium]MDP6061726.1 L-seryl-tRNA(Sec) selenium transferase [Acidimicrobiales bacterium]MDP6214507.1 L-seryl-tRNA(Sec) selenium transferase [Acidimicrobiales bacterium]MDP7208885.1 L-seryl-tRNA(Sec) selenium transferase [Acidimicrobiales bacterium]HJO98739.1 L-seryl-tRNA(Sec) selenium transferase [Acidimicrobiales bacterium]